jgi:dihydrofolate reductase
MKKMGQGPMSGMETFVFSRTLQQQKHPNVTILGEKAEETVAALRANLLGDGIPLLPSLATRTGLKLINHRVYKKTGIISLEYSVQHTA